MEMEGRKPFCPDIDVDGVISGGKQFDLDITLPEDTRNVIYGVIKNCFKEPVSDAVVKLTEVVCEDGKEERKPIGHTFTDCEGEFVFGPLCPNKHYAIQIWANVTKKIKVCAKCHHEGKCLKGEKCDKCDCFIDTCKECKDCKNDEKYEDYKECNDCKNDEKYEDYKECNDCKNDEKYEDYKDCKNDEEYEDDKDCKNYKNYKYGKY